MISKAYAPTSSSICGMLFLPNSTRRVLPACRTRADPSLTDRSTNGEGPCRLTARASPFASHGPRLAGDGARNGRAGRTLRTIRGGHMDEEKDTDGTTDAHEGNDAPRTVPGRRAKAASSFPGSATNPGPIRPDRRDLGPAPPPHSL